MSEPGGGEVPGPEKPKVDASPQGQVTDAAKKAAAAATRRSPISTPISPSKAELPEIVAKEILEEKGKKSVGEAAELAEKGKFTDAIKALQTGQNQPPESLAKLALLQEQAEEESEATGKPPKPLELEDDHIESLAKTFAGQDPEEVAKQLATYNLSKETIKKLLPKIPQESVENSKDNEEISQGQREVMEAQLSALDEQVKNQLEEVEESIKHEPNRIKRFRLKRMLGPLKAQAKYYEHKLKHWLDADKKEWTVRFGKFMYWSMIIAILFIIYYMNVVNKMTRKK